MWLGGSAGRHDGATRLQNGGESCRKLPAVSGRRPAVERQNEAENLLSTADRKRPMKSDFQAGQNRPPAK